MRPRAVPRSVLRSFPLCPIAHLPWFLCGPLALLAMGQATDVRACTIGVAAGQATADGRPLLWKTRDLGEVRPNALRWETDGDIPFLTVIDAAQPDFSWMGLNEAGFAVVNAYASPYGVRDGKAEMNNGMFMRHALGICRTVEDFTALLDSTNATGRLTSGNFGAIDADGRAAMFEVTSSAYVRFDPGSDGFVVRTNFLVTGVGDQTGRERYDRARAILGDLVAAGRLTNRALLREEMRDFAAPTGIPWSVPQDDRQEEGWPHGYIDFTECICRATSVSAAVIQGVLPGEAAPASVMWTMLGPPATAIAVPFWPVGGAPDAALGGLGAPLWLEAQRLKTLLVKSAGSELILDTYALRDENGSGLWTQLLPVEDEILDEAEASLDAWREGMPDPETVLALETRLAERALATLRSASVDQRAEARFIASPSSGCAPLAVTFRDASLHAPTSWEWDFDGDAIADSHERDPAWMCPAPGRYAVSLVVRNDAGESRFSLADAVVAMGPPATPGSCAASTNRVESVLVTWTDGSEDEDEFVVYRNGRQIGSAPAGGARYEDRSARVGRLYQYRVSAANGCGESAMSEAAPGSLAPPLTLRGPVPFRESVGLDCAIPPGARFSLTVLDAAGRLVARVAEGAGSAEVMSASWDGMDLLGVPAPAGVYFAVLEFGGSARARLVLVR